MANPTLHSWLWFGVASIALMSNIDTPAQAQSFIGNRAPNVTVDYSALDNPRAPKFAVFSGSKPLMPGLASTLPQDITLTPPHGVMLTQPGQRPPGGYKFIIPEQKDERVILTAPPGTRVYLTKPRTRTVAKVRRPKAVAKTPTEDILIAAVEPAPIAKPAPPAPAMQPPKAPDVEKNITATLPPTPAEPLTKATNSASAPTAQDITPAAPAEIETAKVKVLEPAETPVADIKTDVTTPAVPPLEKAPVVEAIPPANVVAEIPAAKETTPIRPVASAPVVQDVVPAKVIAPAPPPVPARVAAAPAIPDVQVASIPTPAAPEKTADTASANATPTATIALVFPIDETHLNSDHEAMLKGITDELNTNPDSAIQLVAYATSENHSKARRLSLSRALAVRSYLLKHDIRNTRIQVRAMGDQAASGKADRVDVILKRP